MDDYKKLQYALITDDLSEFKKVLPDCDVNAVSGTGMNILHYYLSDSFEYNPSEVVDLLVGVGIDIDAQTNQGLTALRYTVNSKNLEQCSAILNYDCDLDLPDSHGVSPLMRAVMDYKGEEQLFKIIQLLIKNGADPHKANNSGLSSLSVVNSNGEAIDQGVQPKEKDLRPLFRELGIST